MFSQRTFNLLFWGVFILIILYWVVIGSIAVGAYHEYKDNNQSIGRMIGSFYKDFKEASE